VLTTSMSELRKIFGDTARNQRFIATVYRRGYRFIAPVVPANEAQAASAPVPETPAAWSEQRLASAASASQVIRKFPRRRGFVGREQERIKLVELLAGDPDCRILTLVGPGGIGKTRLALAVVKTLSELEDHPFDEGFFAVALQALDREDDIFSAIADALDLQYSGTGTLREHVQDYLENKRILLLLDNFEHLLEHSSALPELITMAPHLKILVTSRESLPISEAWFHPVNGLDYDQSADADAVRMFARVAERNQPEFELRQKLPAVLRICRLVEGMPLALEMAAAWLKMLSIDEVADEIEKSIDILADQYGDDHDRHASVRAIFLESWQRLSKDERRLMKQLAVFRGGADRNAINEVIGAGLPLLARLVNKALLRTTHQLRYRMHELIRQYAEERLADNPRREAEARERHARYYLDWMGAQIERLRNAEQGDACRTITANIDNIRAAWRWAVAERRIDMLRGAIRSVSLFSDLRGYFQDGLQLFDAAREMIAASDHPDRNILLDQIDVRSAILNFRLSRYDTSLALFRPVLESTDQVYERCLILRFLGDFHYSHAGHISAEQARVFLNECIELGRQQGDIHVQSECLSELAILYTNMIIDIDESRRCATRAVELARETGRPDLLATALDVLAWTTNHQGDYESAEATWREVFDIAYNSGNRSNEALAMNWLGWSAWSFGGARHGEAVQYFSDALTRYQELGDRANVAMTSADLATVLLEQGELDAAREHCRRGLELASLIGRKDHRVYNRYVLGAVECAAGNLAGARAHLEKSLIMAWEQEEQTNKPVVMYYIAQLLYAEHRAGIAAEDRLDEIVRLLLFLQYYPPNWQVFKDRAARFLETLEAENEGRDFAALHAEPEHAVIETVIAGIPDLMRR
ncbi:MAG TPA: tetratricopeptide repeat protein, partial [Gammaproteobacteria bacterium]|nr:tetratricopeptide repeat protein [Gammaproteobacteria bacterium]